MYLFFVKQDFISSTNIQDMFEQSDDDNNLVHCYSTGTLLKIVEKLTPDLVVIDYDLIDDEFTGFFKTLRSKCETAHLLVLINPEDFERLRVAIEQGDVDEYLVKPVERDDFLARVHIATRRKHSVRKEYFETQVDEDEFGISPLLDSIEIDDSIEKNLYKDQFPDSAVVDTISENDYDLLGFGKKEGHEDTSKVKNSFRSIFDDEPYDRQKEPVGDDIKSFEDTLAGEKEKLTTWDLLPKDNIEQKLEPGPAVVRPADEFISEYKFEENDWQEEYFNGVRPGVSTGHDDEKISRGRRRNKQKTTGSSLARGLSIIGNIFFVIILLMMAVISFFLIQDRLTEEVPRVAGYNLLVIMNDNMSPEFDTGSLVFVREIEPDKIIVGDIITFSSQTAHELIFAGRVVDIDREDGLRFVTRGDANSIEHPDPVLSDNVIGRVTGSLPYVGYPIDYARTREGLIVLVIIPGILIIIFQVTKIINYFSKGVHRRKRARIKI